MIPKPKITSAFKKKIVKDWNVFFPTFTGREPTGISRRVGSLLISISFRIASHREYYMPGFGVHNFCTEFDFLTIILDTPLRTIRTNAEDSITVRAHENGAYIEAAERMRQQSLLPLDGAISLNMIIKAYKDYLANGGSKSISLVEDPALIAAWAGQEKKAQELLEWGYKEFATWSENSHQRRGGLENWLKSMQERISDPARLREIAEEQAVFHKVDHIPQEELIID